MHSFEQASAYVAALTLGCPDAVIDWRILHDTNKAVPGIKRRGTIDELWSELCQWNASGYGVFCCINAMDGAGAELHNVAYIRSHIVDLDNLSAPANYQRACTWTPAPSFAVQSSANKFHVYWRVQPYTGNDYASMLQRKLRQLFDGDKAVIDPTRVLRVPGFFNWKYGEPQMVSCWSLNNFGQLIDVRSLESALASVNVIDGGFAGRNELGDIALAAPSIEWCMTALNQTDPNSMSRDEWIRFTAAWKQAAWTHGDPDTLFQIWSDWCARYSENDPGENLKQWRSIRNTEIGWKFIVNQVPSIKANLMFGGVQRTVPDAPAAAAAPGIAPSAVDLSSEILTDIEQQEYFKGCFYIERFGQILTPSGRMMGAGAFNGAYGGKQLLITSTGKLTDEPWKAATRSTLWTVPRVDHIRFLPHAAPGDIVIDELGRKGVNVFKPAIIRSTAGDVSLFLRHIDLMLPTKSDQKALFDYLAHNARFPGHKIPWAPLVQSAEGVGKGVLKRIIERFIGTPYFYSPSARELIESGSKFNAWMRNKLFILVDEIRVDERRDMVEILKPMISEFRIEIQGKGQDQDVEDNYSNWMFFSNYKSAIPVDQNSRRFAMFFSALQSKADIVTAGMDDAYFNRLYGWLDGGGSDHVTHWLQNYPVERGTLPMRAPETSSSVEAQRVSRTPHEQAILNAVSDRMAGFLGGWVSSLATAKVFRLAGLRVPNDQSLVQIMERLGYHHIGRAHRSWFQESSDQRSEIFALSPVANLADFGRAQGYE